MRHYRIYKLDEDSGRIVKGKDLEATDDREAMKDAAADDDCPTCEVWQGTAKVGTIE